MRAPFFKKPKHRKSRGLVVAAGAMLLIGSVITGVLVPTESASATVPVVTGTATCNTATGLFDISWRVSGDTGHADEVATIVTQSVATSPTLVDLTVQADGYVEGVQSGVGNGSHTLTVEVQWTNHSEGDLVSQTGRVTASGNCSIVGPPVDPPQHIEYTICHRTNSATNPYVEITVDDDAVDGIAGHSGNEADHYGEHKGPLAYSVAYAQQLKDDKIEWGDIIPVVPGVHSGQNLENGGAEILANGCKLVDEVDPLVAAASFVKTDASCIAAESVTPSGVVNATLTSSTGTTGPGTATLVFTADNDALFPVGDGVSEDRRTLTISVELSASIDDPSCKPKPPDEITFSDGEPEAVCLPGDVKPLTVTFERITTTVKFDKWDGSKWIAGTTIVSDPVTITIPTPEGFVFDCPLTLIDTPPALVPGPPTCTANGTLPTPATGEHFTFAWAPATTGPGTYVGTYTTKPGHTFAGEKTSVSYTVVVAAQKVDPSCDIKRPVPQTDGAPDFTWPIIWSVLALLLICLVVFWPHRRFGRASQ